MSSRRMLFLLLRVIEQPHACVEEASLLLTILITLFMFYRDNLCFVRIQLLCYSESAPLSPFEDNSRAHRGRDNKNKCMYMLVKQTVKINILLMHNEINLYNQIFYFCLAKTKWFICFLISLPLAYLIILLYLIIKMLSNVHFVPSHGMPQLCVSMIDVFNKISNYLLLFF